MKKLKRTEHVNNIRKVWAKPECEKIKLVPEEAVLVRFKTIATCADFPPPPLLKNPGS
jgi:hypothetical protein